MEIELNLVFLKWLSFFLKKKKSMFYQQDSIEKSMILLAPKNGIGDGCITHKIEVTLVHAGMIYFSLDSK